MFLKAVSRYLTQCGLILNEEKMYLFFSHLQERQYFDAETNAGQGLRCATGCMLACRYDFSKVKSAGRFATARAAGSRFINEKTTSDVMIVDRKTISIMKACELVGVSRRTIYNWIGSGKVEYVRTAGGSVRIFVDTLWRRPEDTVRSQPVGEQRRLD